MAQPINSADTPTMPDARASEGIWGTVLRAIPKGISDWYAMAVVVAGAAVTAYKHLTIMGDSRLTLGTALTFVGLILVIHKTARDVANLQKQSTALIEKASALASIEDKLSTVVTQNDSLRQLPSLLVRHGKAHTKATRDTAKSMFDAACDLAAKAHAVQRNEGSEIRILDHNPIATLLINLGKRLPTGAVWLGTTLVTSGWQDQLEDGQDGLHEFAREMQRRTKRREIQVCRIYCVKDVGELEQIRGHLKQELDGQTEVRYYVYGDKQPADLTLVFEGGAIAQQAPATALMESVGAPGLFALRFDVAPPTVVRKVVLYEPRDPEFIGSAPLFDEIFDKSHLYIA
jgi:hypothetical protein